MNFIYDNLYHALSNLIMACDKGRPFERGSGGMTIDAQLSRTVINGVSATAVEDARFILNNTKRIISPEFKIGDKVKVREDYKYSEWVGLDLYVVGIFYDVHGEIDITVSESWPPTLDSRYTNGFYVGKKDYPDDLVKV